MRIFALDLGVAVGWQLFNGRRQLRHGTHPLPSRASVDDYGTRCDALFTWTATMLGLLKPELVAFEAPLVPVANWSWDGKLESTATIVRGLISYAAVVELAAFRAGIRCIEVNAQSAKLALTGSRWAKKRQMIAAAVRAGYHVANEHEADAVGVALAALAHVAA